jgi:peptidylprolyl isomerase
MKIGERAILRCRSDYAYGKNGQGKIPANATLNFDVELLGFGPKKKEPWETSDEEKNEEALKLKESGTLHFQNKKFNDALKDYEEAAELIEAVTDSKPLWITCKLNSALAAINLIDYPSAISFSTQVLKSDPTNVKALYRRGLARNHSGLPEEALEDLNKALELDVDNKAVKIEIAKSKKSILDAKKKAKAAYGNMFSKISVYDDKEVLVVPGTAASNPKVLFNYLFFKYYVFLAMCLLLFLFFMMSSVFFCFSRLFIGLFIYNFFLIYSISIY